MQCLQIDGGTPRVITNPRTMFTDTTSGRIEEEKNPWRHFRIKRPKWSHHACPSCVLGESKFLLPVPTQWQSYVTRVDSPTQSNPLSHHLHCRKTQIWLFGIGHRESWQQRNWSPPSKKQSWSSNKQCHARQLPVLKEVASCATRQAGASHCPGARLDLVLVVVVGTSGLLFCLSGSCPLPCGCLSGVVVVDVAVVNWWCTSGLLSSWSRRTRFWESLSNGTIFN